MKKQLVRLSTIITAIQVTEENIADVNGKLWNEYRIGVQVNPSETPDFLLYSQSNFETPYNNALGMPVSQDGNYGDFVIIAPVSYGGVIFIVTEKVFLSQFIKAELL